jgi:uncharacterized protein YeaO (DUF488 family)
MAIMKHVDLYTVQISRWRLVRELGIHLLDVTAKSGIAAFAPLYEDVMSFKRGKMNWDEYKAIYEHRMVQSKRENKEEWEKLKALGDKVAIACYCGADEVHCHRHIFRHIYSDYLKDAQFEVTYHGEIRTYLPVAAHEVPDKKEDAEHVLNT